MPRVVFPPDCTLAEAAKAACEVHEDPNVANPSLDRWARTNWDRLVDDDQILPCIIPVLICRAMHQKRVKARSGLSHTLPPLPPAEKGQETQTRMTAEALRRTKGLLDSYDPTSQFNPLNEVLSHVDGGKRLRDCTRADLELSISGDQTIASGLDLVIAYHRRIREGLHGRQTVGNRYDVDDLRRLWADAMEEVDKKRQ